MSADGSRHDGGEVQFCTTARGAQSINRCLLVVLLFAFGILNGCTEDSSGVVPTPASAATRAERRAFSGAPPVIPHPPLSGTCTTCHTPQGGQVVAAIGIAPANPHTQTPGMSDKSRCKQCHVFQLTDETFVNTEFVAYFSGDTTGDRMFETAPPVIPHAQFMREDCSSCHAGAAARPEITCRHAHRDRCVQCHVHQQTTETFPAAL